ncbi:MAG: hypothetical protein HKN12_00565 [Gemmatimonadetes bacterium]|nr:hypothetical protein [Gemmatimonadota bacterium]
MIPWLRRFAFPLALGGGLLAVLIVRPAPDSGPEQFARLDPPRYRPVPGMTDAAGPASAEFLDAVEAYQDSRWDLAAPLFADAAEGAGDGTSRGREARLYEGLCRLFAGQAADALSPLQVAATEDTFEISIRARWYLAQAHLVLGDVDAARPLLDDLSRTPAYARDASRQLAALQRH